MANNEFEQSFKNNLYEKIPIVFGKLEGIVTINRTKHHIASFK